jgi:hypothetical protein
MTVLRAGREIDYAWKLFGAKRRENYDDWWRCELSFDPALDEEFGVTHSKQGITPTPRLREALAADLEAIARALNGRVRAQFNARKPGIRTAAERTASSKDALIPIAGTLGSLHRGQLGMAYRLAACKLDDGAFFRVEYQNDHLQVTLNTEHPFFERVYQPAQQAYREGLELVLLSAARAGLGVKMPGAERFFASFLSDWSDSLHTFLE